MFPRRQINVPKVITTAIPTFNSFNQKAVILEEMRTSGRIVAYNSLVTLILITPVSQSVKSSQ